MLHYSIDASHQRLRKSLKTLFVVFFCKLNKPE